MHLLRPFDAITGYYGRVFIRTVMYVINLMTFSTLALKDWFNNNSLFKSRSYSTIASQIIFTGIDALPTITFLALATGFIFTFRLISILASLGTANETVELLISIICLGLGPFLAAIIIISRTGSAIVVDIANMKLHGEIAALEYSGVNINEYLIAPRIIGTAISQLAITIYFTTISLVTGVVISAYTIDPTHIKLLAEISHSFSPMAIAIFFLKNILFGFVIATVACYNGLRLYGSPTEVPQRTTASIIQTLIFIFAIDGLLALAVFT